MQPDHGPFGREGPRDRGLIAATATTSLGGAVCGALLAWWAAPTSSVGWFISVASPPIALTLSLFGWGLVAVVSGAVRLATRGPGTPPPDWRPPGAWVFVPICVACEGAAGVLVGLAPGGTGVLMGGIVYGTFGGLYGLANRWLARRGRLAIVLPD